VTSSWYVPGGNRERTHVTLRLRIESAMTGIRYVWLVCGLAVLILDIVGSLAARHWGFSYGNLSAISFLIYFCAGAGAGRLAGIWAGGVAGAITGLIDATVGWAIASALGIVSRAGPSPSPATTLLVALGVVLTSWVLGLLGGAVGKAVHRSVGADV
jgi:hypothetical protein